jgi:hypothetical protein
VRGRLARPWHLVPRVGLLLAALAGLIAAFTGGLGGAEQLDGLATVDISPTRIGTIGIAGAALMVGVAVAPWPLWRVIGVGMATLLGVVLLLLVVGLRTADDLLAGVSVDLATGGWLLVLAAILIFAGIGLALVSGFVVPDEMPAGLQRRPQVDRLALVLVVMGIALPPLAASGAALGQYALHAGAGRRPLAKAAIGCGIAIVAIWALALFVGALSAQP